MSYVQRLLSFGSVTVSPRNLLLVSGVKNMTDCDDVGPLDDVLLPCQFLPVLPITNTGKLPLPTGAPFARGRIRTLI